MKARQAKRLARTISAISLLVVIGAGATSISTAADQLSSGESKYTQLVVAPGESLWSIAAMVAADGQIAATVADIVAVNNLTGADLSAGMRLLVPIKS